MSAFTHRALFATCVLLAVLLPNATSPQSAADLIRTVEGCNPVTYIVTPASGPENGTVPLMFFVYRIGGALEPTSIQYSTYDLTATSPADYSGTSGTLWFGTYGPTDNVGQINVWARPDNVVEPPETLQLILYGTGTQPPITSAIGTIHDSTTYLCNNDGACGVGETPENCPRDCWVNPLNCDYNFACGSYENSKDCPSDCGLCNHNGVCEGYEKNPSCASDCPLPPLTLLPLPSLSILRTEGVEGSSPGNLYFSVVRNGDPSRSVTVSYTTSDLTAQAGSDYVAKSGALTFYSGEVRKEDYVVVLGDSVEESTESFRLSLTNPQGATLAVGSADATIVDDDVMPVLSILRAAGAESSSTLSFLVVRSGNLSRVSTVQYATFNGTAIAGSDYVAENGALTFAVGDTQKQIDITVLDDGVAEDTERFGVELSNAQSANLVVQSAEATIIDEDPPSRPLISIASAFAQEGNSGQALMSFLVKRAATDQAGEEAVQYSTFDGTAGAGTDYIATSGTLTFRRGEDQKNILVPIVGDTSVEGTEYFSVQLTTEADGSHLIGAAAGVILDDDVGPPAICSVSESPDPGYVPGYNAIYAPPTDGDGTFTVRWSAGKPSTSPLCRFGSPSTWFKFERARNADFSDAIVLSTSEQSYRASSLTSGTYFFKVSACYSGDPAAWFCGDYCDEAFAGSNATQVLCGVGP